MLLSSGDWIRAILRPVVAWQSLWALERLPDLTREHVKLHPVAQVWLPMWIWNPQLETLIKTLDFI